MSKKAFVIFILALIAVFAAIGWFFLFRIETIPGLETAPGRESDPFPFGERAPEPGSLPKPSESEPATTTIDFGSYEASQPRLRQISTAPVAGAVAYGKGPAAIRYIERATGHIYETLSDSALIRRVSSVTIPKVQEALWAEDGSRLLIRYLKDDGETIRTFYGRIASTTRPEQALEGLFLPEGIRTIAVRGAKAFYIIESESGAQGMLSNLDGTGRTNVFTSAFSDWSARWTSPASVVLYSRPSGASLGSAFSLELSSGRLAKAAGEEVGLSAVGNADGGLVLISGIGPSGLSAATIDLRSGASSLLGVATLAEKCVWSSRVKTDVYCAVPQSLPSGIYPDDWYKGKVSTSDSLWKISTLTGETVELMSPELESGVSMDIIKLSLDPDEKIVLFTNKKDMTLWRYEL